MLDSGLLLDDDQQWQNPLNHRMCCCHNAFCIHMRLEKAILSLRPRFAYCTFASRSSGQTLHPILHTTYYLPTPLFHLALKWHTHGQIIHRIWYWSNINRLSPHLFFAHRFCNKKKSWGVEPGNEAMCMTVHCPPTPLQT